MIHDLDLLQPPNRIAFDVESSAALADEVGFPLVVRPSYVLGGRAMEIVYDQDDLANYMKEAVKIIKDSPILLDRFLDEAIEVDVDAICDGKDVVGLWFNGAYRTSGSSLWRLSLFTTTLLTAWSTFSKSFVFK